MNAGTYTVKASFAGNSNYEPASATTTITIDKAPSTTVVTCPVSVTYDGSGQTPCTAKVTGAGGLDDSVTVSYSHNTDAGKATANASFGGDDNHKPSDDSKTFTIDKADASVSITWTDGTYNTNPHPAAAVVDGVGGETDLSPSASLTYYTGSDTTGTPLLGAPTDAGTYTVQASFAGNSNYKPASATTTITIDKAPSTTVVTCPVSVTYDGSGQTPCTATVTGAGGLDEPVTVSYSHNTDAGTATASASFGGDDNHKPSDDSKTFTIDKATPSVSVSWSGWTFDGTAHAASGSVSGVGSPAANLGNPDSFTYYAGSTTSGTPLPAAPKDAGTYTVVAHFNATANYTAADSAEKTVTVSKATPSVSVNWTDWTFDGTAHAASGSVSGVGSPAANLGNPDSFTYYAGPTASGSPLLGAPTDAGAYTVVAHFNATANYTAADSAEKTVTVSKATPSVSVNWTDWTFDGTAHQATGSVSGVGSPATSLGSADSFAYYSGSDASGTPLPAAPKDAGTYTVVAHFNATANYTAADSAAKTVTVSKATPSVSVSWAGWTFDGTAHQATGLISGVGSPAANLGNPDFAYYSGSTATGSPLPGAPMNAGTYTVKASFAGNGNYNPGSMTKTITIDKAELTVKADDKTRAYDGSPFTGFTRTITGFATGDGESVIGGTVSFTGNAIGATNAGTYTIIPNVSGLSAANYTFKPANGSLTIGKVQLTVKADNKSKPFDGMAFTAFTSGITGLVNGENASVVSGSVTYTGSAVGASTVGTYAIMPVTSGLSATNYSFTAVSGTLTIGAWSATGFYDPVGVNNSEFVTSGGAVPNIAATGVWNTAKSGSTVPLKFNLYTAQGGTQLTTTASVQSFDLVKLTSCSGTATDDAVDYFATTGATSLRYDGTAGQFIQNWKTPSVNSDTCYRVNVKFLDGSAIYAFFKLRK
jgi:hypothetical protein